MTNNGIERIKIKKIQLLIIYPCHMPETVDISDNQK